MSLAGEWVKGVGWLAGERMCASFPQRSISQNAEFAWREIMMTRQPASRTLPTA